MGKPIRNIKTEYRSLEVTLNKQEESWVGEGENMTQTEKIAKKIAEWDLGSDYGKLYAPHYVFKNILQFQLRPADEKVIDLKHFLSPPDYFDGRPEAD